MTMAYTVYIPDPWYPGQFIPVTYYEPGDEVWTPDYSYLYQTYYVTFSLDAPVVSAQTVTVTWSAPTGVSGGSWTQNAMSLWVQDAANRTVAQTQIAGSARAASFVVPEGQDYRIEASMSAFNSYGLTASGSATSSRFDVGPPPPPPVPPPPPFFASMGTMERG